MNFPKLRKKLSKLNNLLNSLENSGEVPNKIERDLIKNYILDLYETAISDNDQSNGKKKAEDPDEIRQISQPSVKATPPVLEERTTGVPAETPVSARTETFIEKRETTVIQSQPQETEARFSFVEEPEVKVTAETKTYTAGTEGNKAVQSAAAKNEEISVVSNGRVNISEELFLLEMGMEVSDKLANLPLKTLKGAVGINDKILLVNQLFKGDMGKYNEMIDAIDKMGSFQQAKSFIQSEIVTKYNWTDEDKANTAKGFIRLINRRFLN